MYRFEASNAKGAEFGAVPVSEIGTQYLKVTKLRFKCSSKLVNYEARILGLRAALSKKIEDHSIRGFGLDHTPS